MGIKGDKNTEDAKIAVELLSSKLQTIEGITTKKMFGGYGVFHEGKMFGIVDSKGKAFLKADDSNMADFEDMGAQKHGRMPYFSIPETIMSDIDELLRLTKRSIQISK